MKKYFPGKDKLRKIHAHMCTQTHIYTHINTNKKLATEHKEEESICTKSSDLRASSVQLWNLLSFDP